MNNIIRHGYLSLTSNVFILNEDNYFSPGLTKFLLARNEKTRILSSGSIDTFLSKADELFDVSIVDLNAKKLFIYACVTMA